VANPTTASRPATTPASSPEPAPASQSADDSGWNVTVIPGAAAPATAATKTPSKSAPESPAKPAGRPAGTTTATTASGNARYGEAVVREILGANFLEEQSLSPRDAPATLGDVNPQPGPEA
jgi:DNA polymerase-3 subunit gamma/tau